MPHKLFVAMWKPWQGRIRRRSLRFVLCCFVLALSCTTGSSSAERRRQSESAVASWDLWDTVLQNLSTSEEELDLAVDGSTSAIRRGIPLWPATLENGDTVRLVHLASFLPFLGGTIRLASYDEMAAVLLALRHLNHPEESFVTTPDRYSTTTCDLRFTSALYDTRLNEILSTEIFSTLLQKGNPVTTEPPPSALVGAFRSAVTAPLSILAAVHGLPVVSPAATSAALDDNEVYPTVARTCPSTTQEAEAVWNLVADAWHVDALAVLYVGDTFGSSFARELQERAAAVHADIITVPFSWSANDNEAAVNDASIQTAVARIAASQFRYIVGIALDHQYEAIMQAAHAVGLTGEENVWLFYGVDEQAIQRRTSEDQSDAHESNWRQATQGLGIINFAIHPPEVEEEASSSVVVPPTGSASTSEKFQSLWSTVLTEPDFLEYYATKLPLDVAEAPPFLAEPRSSWTYSTYDAVLALGLSLCEVSSSFPPNQTTLPVAMVMDEFVNLTFAGASGNVAFTEQHTRSTPQFTLWNVQPPISNSSQQGFTLTPSAHYEDRKWSVLKPFVFRNGDTGIRSSLLSNPVDVDNISDFGAFFGTTMAGLCFLVCLGCSTWTYCYRNSSVVGAAQPTFLYLIALSSLFEGIALLSRIWYRWGDRGGAGISCQIGFWCFFAGTSLSSGALLAKTWGLFQTLRIPEIERLVVTTKDFVFWVGGILAYHFVIFVLWGTIDPLRYEISFDSATDALGRPLSGSTVCASENETVGIIFFVTILVANLILCIMGNYWSIRCRSIETEYSESQYISFALGTKFETQVIGLPLAMFSRESPDIHYVVLIGVVGLLGVINPLLIFVPKVYALRKDMEGSDGVATSSVRSVRENSVVPGSMNNLHHPGEFGARIKHPETDDVVYDADGRVQSIRRGLRYASVHVPPRSSSRLPEAAS